MKNLLHLVALSTLSLLFVQPLFANNMGVSNVSLIQQNTVDKFIMVQFDLTWNNSWRSVVNWDAAWVFAKFSTDGGSTWMHASMNTSGHNAPSGSTIDTPIDGRGVFIYRDAIGEGTVNFSGVQLRWNYGDDAVADDATVRIQVFAIEMVLVPESEFAAGSGGGGVAEFTLTTISTADATMAPSGGGSRGGEAGGFPTGEAAPANAAWPNGFSAFYCMKYELTQDQYADFLNTLTSTQAATRNLEPQVNPAFDRYGITGRHPNFSAGKPFVPCTHLNWMDGAAYADWSGLRPMTELEYEKACRGSQIPVADELAWGTTALTAAAGINNDGAANERPGNGDANCAVSGILPGPLRAGSFATSTSTREQAGASFYGIMELSGNMWERAVTISNVAGRAFVGSTGDGRLSERGNATNSDWPGFANGEVTSATGSGFRGGSWCFGTAALPVSDRDFAALDFITRDDGFGFRGVRSAP